MFIHERRTKNLNNEDKGSIVLTKIVKHVQLVLFFLLLTIQVSYASNISLCEKTVKDIGFGKTISAEQFASTYSICTDEINEAGDSNSFYWRGILIYRYAMPNFIFWDGIANRDALIPLMEKAISDFSVVVSRNPNDYEAYSNRGVIYGKLRKPALALADFERAIKINPRFEWVYLNRAHVYTDMGKYNEAQKDFQTAITVNPQFLEGFRFKAIFTSAFLNDPCGAMDDYERAYFLANTNPSVIFDYAVAIEDCYCKDHDNKSCSVGKEKASTYYKQIISIASSGDFYYKAATKKLLR